MLHKKRQKIAKFTRFSLAFLFFSLFFSCVVAFNSPEKENKETSKKSARRIKETKEKETPPERIKTISKMVFH